MLSSVNKETGELSQVAGRQATADKIFYDNSETGIPASNVQEAIDKSTRIWNGTKADWDLLPLSEKVKYDYTAFDGGSNDNEITLFICDSYGDTDTDDEGITDFLPECFANSLGGLTKGTNFFVACGDGSGFTNKGVVNKNFLDLLNELAANASFNNLSVKNIIVAGGWNDMGASSYTALANAITAFAERAKIVFPNALVSLALSAWSKDGTNKANLIGKVLPCYSHCVSIAKTGNIRYLVGTEYMNHDYSLFSSDYCHPSKAGYVALGEYLAQAYKQGCVNPRYLETKYNSQSTDNGFKIQQNTVFGIYCNITETADSFTISYAHFPCFEWGTTDTPAIGSFVKIGELQGRCKDVIWAAVKNDPWYNEQNITITLSDNSTIQSTGVLFISGQDIMLYVQSIMEIPTGLTVKGINIAANCFTTHKLAC